LNISNTDKPKDPSAKPTTPAQQLLQRDVNRKEFIATVGFGMVSIMGFSSIIHFLTGHKSGRSVASASRGYGSGPYGG
jgi:hypothetical protein